MEGRRLGRGGNEEDRAGEIRKDELLNGDSKVFT